ncbi:MAG: TerC family protein [Pseudomonadota bacterium]|nr:TerC family protein [Pseudomonadota bacterium]
MQSMGTWWLWLIFGLVVLAMLAIDLFLFKGGQQHRVSLKEAAGWSIAWVTTALVFNAGLWWYLDSTAGRAEANETASVFLSGYLLEKSLAVDNVFVWMLIFRYFAVPVELQRRVLLYGIVGAVALRAIMVFAGSWLISRFEWILLLFGAFLVFTGLRMWFGGHDDPDLSQNRILQWVRRHQAVTERLQGERFFVMQNGVRHATPLLLALILVELSDVVFAVDSIPAIFALTRDPFIVLTSNLFAILGLRAMYFLLAEVGNRLSMLQYGLAGILVFIGVKMLIEPWWHMPTPISLGVVVGTLALSVAASLLVSRRQSSNAPDRP